PKCRPPPPKPVTWRKRAERHSRRNTFAMTYGTSRGVEHIKDLVLRVERFVRRQAKTDLTTAPKFSGVK
ncbi:MAG: hypothetical protein WAK31_31950, partial [Chthoniobacterales bacterium]